MPFDQTNVESPRTRNLRKALELITPKWKWCVGERHDSKGRMCALGALESAMGDHVRLSNETPEVLLLAARARPLSESSRFSPAARVASHNNVLGHAATLQMFIEAIADSVAIDRYEGGERCCLKAGRSMSTTN